MESVIIALSADLIFGARIRNAAESAGVRVILAKNVEDFLTQVHSAQPRLAILDMDRRGLDVSDVVGKVKAEGVELLAYVSHVREDLIDAARAAGADRVMARGAFAKQLPELLRG
jgi:CheY-like chemotaxis protein